MALGDGCLRGFGLGLLVVLVEFVSHTVQESQPAAMQRRMS